MKRAISTLAPLALVTVAAAAACSGKTLPPPGQILVRLDSDLPVPAKWNQLGLDITVNGEPILSSQYAVGTTELVIPATIDIVQGKNPGTFVTVRAAALRDGTTVVAQQFVTQVPSNRTALLHVALEAACVGVSCATGQTCKSGACTSAQIDSATLPDYTGGGAP